MGRKWRVLEETRSPAGRRCKRRLCADGLCSLSPLFFELIQFIVIRFSIDCIVRWGSETRLIVSPGSWDGRAVAHSRISHVINLPVSVCAVSFHYTQDLISLSLLLAHVNCVRTRSWFVCPIFSEKTNKSKF